MVRADPIGACFTNVLRQSKFFGVELTAKFGSAAGGKIEMLQLHNTMSRQMEQFEPNGGRTVKMFSCGPSIYRRPHVGNYRTFAWEDVLQRYLEYLGYEVQRAINLTDIEDKALEEAKNDSRSVEELTGAVARRFFDEAGSLGIKLPENMPRSSTSVTQAAAIIRKLLESGFAYRHGNNIFFDPLKFEGFGKLFRLDMSKWPKTKKRFKKDTYPGQRWNLGDFILWHGFKDGDQVYWDTEIGKGRPAWNIQDPAMILQTLGYGLDIFCGGIDNIYRHHDYNIAVMESFSGVELSRFWLHGQHVLADGQKMSKSLNNIIYPEDLLAGGVSWKHLRFYLIYTYYRKKVSFTDEDFRRVCSKLDELRSMVAGLIDAGSRTGSSTDQSAEKMAGALMARFETGMNDDLDTRTAIDGVMETVRSLDSLARAGKLGGEQARVIEGLLRRIDQVLNVIFE